jgi:hypothetical protein
MSASDFVFTSQNPAGNTSTSFWGRVDITITTLVPTAALEDLDNDSEMWNMYLNDERRIIGSPMLGKRVQLVFVTFKS